MFDKRPTRWRDLPRRRSDVFLPVLTPWEDGEAKVAAVERAWQEPAAHLGRRRRAGDLRPAVRPLPAQAPPRHRAARGQADRGRVPGAPRRAHLGGARARPGLPRLRARARSSTPRAPYPSSRRSQRWAMVLHNQYPWDRSRTQLRPVSRDRRRRLGDRVPPAQPRRDGVPRPRAVGRAPSPSRSAEAQQSHHRRAAGAALPRRSTCARRSACSRALESLAVARGEIVCDNADVVRNASFSWSPMSADEILKKTGIAQRRYTAARASTTSSLAAAKGALAHAGRSAEEIGAVLVATCTSDRLIPSLSHVALRRARHPADPLLGRHRRRLRGLPVRPLGGGAADPGDRAAGAAGLRGEVLRQDRRASGRPG